MVREVYGCGWRSFGYLANDLSIEVGSSQFGKIVNSLTVMMVHDNDPLSTEKDRMKIFLGEKQR